MEEDKTNKDNLVGLSLLLTTTFTNYKDKMIFCLVI